MKKTIFILCYSIFYPAYALKFVTAVTKWSRFGDSLALIYSTMYISKKYNIPAIYQDFVESKNLLIQKKIDEFKKHKFKTKFKFINLVDEKQINFNDKQDIIYVVRIDFFSKYYETIINNKELQEQFKSLIQPIKKINMPCNLREDFFNIALHVRKGGGFDLPLLSRDGLDYNSKLKSNFIAINSETLAAKYRKTKFSYSDLRWPNKFPPDSYYIDQIKKIVEIFPNKKIHIHIFTDDQNPTLLMNKYQKAINEKNVSFSCRENNNKYNKNVTDDFFAMTRFDCLIRPVSTYSQIVEIIGDFKIVISPKHSKWVEKDLLIIDEVNITNNIKL